MNQRRLRIAPARALYFPGVNRFPRSAAGLRLLALSALFLALASCSGMPPRIDAFPVSPDKYAVQACDQIVEQMDAAAGRANELYQVFVDRRQSNQWKITAAILIFSPFALLVEGDEEAEREEYAKLKGEYEALRINAQRKSCGAEAALLEEELAPAEEPTS